MKKNAAIYARVSSDRQKEENTIASQTAQLLEYARSPDYVVPPEWVFQDEGYSRSVLSRPGLERLRDLVAGGQVETVLVHAPDRLGRKYAYQVLLLEEFIEEFQSVLSRFPQVLWSREVDGVTARDSRGHHQLSPAQGIAFRDRLDHIHLVYPFYGGIAVHLDGSSELLAICKQLAELLNAQSFGVPVG